MIEVSRMIVANLEYLMPSSSLFSSGYVSVA